MGIMSPTAGRTSALVPYPDVSPVSSWASSPLDSVSAYPLSQAWLPEAGEVGFMWCQQRPAPDVPTLKEFYQAGAAMCQLHLGSDKSHVLTSATITTKSKYSLHLDS